MSRAQREKGRKAEAEVRTLLGLAGFEVRGLEATGDHLAIGHGVTFHSEVKRQEVLRLPLWTRQAAAEAPDGTIPLVSYRRNHEPWQALAPERLVIERLRAAGAVAGIHYTLRPLNHVWWLHTRLGYLLNCMAATANPASAQAAS